MVLLVVVATKLMNFYFYFFQIRPVIPELQNYQLQLDNTTDLSTLSSSQFPITSSEVPISILPSASNATVQVNS